MSGHVVRVDEFSDHLKASCSCGWIERWYGNDDGSAQQSAAAHERWYTK